MKLTKKNIDSLVYDSGKQTYAGGSRQQDIRWGWECEIPGLGVRIAPDGKKTFVLAYRHQGRKHIMSIGLFGVLTVDQAIAKARKQLAMLDDKIDPLNEKRKFQKGAQLKDLCHEYIERHAKPHKKSWAADQRMIDDYVLPTLGGLRVDAITRSDIAKLHSDIGINQGKPTMANRIREVLGKMFKLAGTWGFIEESAANPATGIQDFPETERDRYVTSEEMPKLIAAIDKEENVYARSAMWLYLLTGLRKQEMLQAKWDDVSFEREEIHIGVTKNGKPLYLPLSKPAVELLNTIPVQDGNPYILCGQKRGHCLVNIDKAWRRVRKEAGIPDVQLHDLRRTVGSWLAQSGNSLHLIGRVLNHKSQKTTQIYARFAQDNVRTALEDHAQKVLVVAGKKPKGDVVPMSG